MACVDSKTCEVDDKTEINDMNEDVNDPNQGMDNHTDDDDGDDNENIVNLGFLEETDPRLLRSHMFPSKVGGWPAWLSLSPLPSPDQLRCRLCSGPCTFLLQVYAPINRFTRAFHRTLFLFVCRNGDCNRQNSAENFHVFRSQLPRVNRFYSCEPPPLLSRPPPPQSTAKHHDTITTSNTSSSISTPDNDDDDDDGDVGTVDDNIAVDFDSDEAPCAVMYQSVCVVCGAAGPKRCGGCLNVTYCGKQHQAVDWKYGHRNVCKNRSSNTHTGGASRDQPGVLFKEYELVTETEELESDVNDSSDDDGTSGGGGDGSTNPPHIKARPNKGNKHGSGGRLSDLEAYARKETSDDKEFLTFRSRIRHDPDQVVRYHLGGDVLWVSSENKPKEHSIPPCSSCGAQRVFEFQVMPQLLIHLDVDLLEDSLDWGMLAVYSCVDSCDIGVQYVQEFLWKQDYSTKRS